MCYSSWVQLALLILSQWSCSNELIWLLSSYEQPEGRGQSLLLTNGSFLLSTAMSPAFYVSSLLEQVHGVCIRFPGASASLGPAVSETALARVPGTPLWELDPAHSLVVHPQHIVEVVLLCVIFNQEVHLENPRAELCSWHSMSTVGSGREGCHPPELPCNFSWLRV